MMTEYTFDNVIINPFKEGLEGLIGKEVYYNSVPFSCVEIANKDLGVGILREIRKGDYFPFCVETHNGDTVNYICYSCIIPKKKESKMKYIPFESTEEFIKRYIEVRKGIESDSIEDNLLQCGMWLRFIKGEQVYQVLAMDKSGIFIVDRYITWKELLKYHSFLDGSPVGKKIENQED